MTKAQLLKALEKFSDDQRVKIAVGDSDDGIVVVDIVEVIGGMEYERDPSIITDSYAILSPKKLTPDIN